MRRSNLKEADADHSIIREVSGACGVLGTFIPHVIGAMTVAGLAPVGVLFGFGVFLISTGLFYGLPMPVQPMKAVSAVILTDGLHPGEVAAAGPMLGLVVLVLGITRWIGRLARMIPQSVSAVATRPGPPDGRARDQARARNTLDRIWIVGRIAPADPDSALSSGSHCARCHRLCGMDDQWRCA
jgi:hypothetical protein